MTVYSILRLKLAERKEKKKKTRPVSEVAASCQGIFYLQHASSGGALPSVQQSTIVCLHAVRRQECGLPLLWLN